MIVTPQPVQLILPQSLTPRSEGVHLSGIIRCIATEQGILKPEWAEELSLADARTITDPAAITRICMGLAWEEFYIRTQLPTATDHPGEILVDGVYMTPDADEFTALVLDGRLGGRYQLHEVKCTYKSINTVTGTNPMTGEKANKQSWRAWEGFPFNSADYPTGPMSSQWMWLAQSKGYCKAAGTRFLTLHVLYACGDYSWPQTPMPYKYDIEFTQAELDDNWDLMIGYRDHFLLELQ